MKVDGSTQLIGLIGWPVSHSFSPAMHNAALAALGLNWIYVPMPVPPDSVGDAVRGLAALGFRGVNVTVPHKQAVIPFLDEITPAAAKIGAVNTIHIDPQSGRLSGANTDWRGFLADLEALDIRVKGRDCLVLGAGGSARGVVYGLSRAGGRTIILARRADQARQLAQALGEDGPHAIRALAELATVIGEADAPLIVNTTPLGMSPLVDESPWPDDLAFPPGAFVYDLVYNPPLTRLMRQALAAGCETSNGLGMLLRQGAASLAIWTGAEPDLRVMQMALKSVQEE